MQSKCKIENSSLLGFCAVSTGE